jgi:hypothetical protein
VDRTLYALVFGESVLNDAVSIVLYHALVLFQAQPVTGGLVLKNAMFFFRYVQRGAVCSVFCVRVIAGVGPGALSPPQCGTGSGVIACTLWPSQGRCDSLAHAVTLTCARVWPAWRLRLRLRVCAHNGCVCSRPRRALQYLRWLAANRHPDGRGERPAAEARPHHGTVCA